MSSSASVSYSAASSNPSGPGSQQVSTIEIRILGGGNHDIRTISFHYKYSQDRVTIKNGSKVVWINEDPAGPRGINLIDAISGKTVFSYPVIPFKSSAEYTFGEARQVCVFRYQKIYPYWRDSSIWMNCRLRIN